MRFLSILLLVSTAWAVDSLTFSSADSRCVNAGGTTSCTFTEMENYPADYGVVITATVTGTWVLQTVTPQCTYRTPAFVLDSTGTAVTTISSTGTYYITQESWSGNSAQGPYGFFECAPGNYTYTLDFLNGSTHVIITLTNQLLYRPAVPIYFNGFGIADSAIPGATLDPMANPAGWIYDLNSIACNPACNPFTSWTPPQNAGDGFVDEFGNTHRVITPFAQQYTHVESGKTPLSMDNSLLLVSTPDGFVKIFDATMASGNSPIYNVAPADIGASNTYCWGSVTGEGKVAYFLQNADFGQSNIITRVVFGVPPAYVATNIYTMPTATYGRMTINQFGHQDCTRDDWLPIVTYKDYTSVVNISGTTVTKVSGSAFDARLVEQNFTSTSGNLYLGVEVLSVNVGAQTLVLTGAPTGGDCTGCTRNFVVPFLTGAIDLRAALAAYLVSGTYVPTTVDISGSALVFPVSSRVLGQQGLYIAGPDPTTGKYYGTSGNGNAHTGAQYESWKVDWTSGNTTANLSTGFINFSDPYTKTCDTPDVPGSSRNNCVIGHATPLTQTDGTPWFSTQDVDGTSINLWRYRDGNSTPTVLAANAWTGSITPIGWFNYVGWEVGNSRGTSTQVASYWVENTSYNGYKDMWDMTCTVASPSVCTLNSAPTFVSGAAVIINGVTGCTNLNGAHVANIVAGATVTLDVNCIGSFGGYTLFGNRAYITAGGATNMLGGNNDQMKVCRDLGVANSCHKIGHTRSIPFTNDPMNFYNIPRAAMSIDGTKIIYASNYGVPGNHQLAIIDLPRQCLGIALNAFDCTGSHFVTPVPSSSGVTLNYTAPNTGTTIVEVGQQKRWTDGNLPTNPSGACTEQRGRSVLSLASGNVYTCNRITQLWALSTPDPSYQSTIDTSGIATHSNIINSLSGNTKHYYRIIANDKWMAAGEFTTNPAAVNYGIQVSGGKINQHGVVVH